jgi:hypothetical protein
MKTINKLMIGLALAAFTIVNVYAQPKSEILEDNKTKINWLGADTLYTFQFNDATNSWVYFQKEIRNFDAKQNATENFVQVWENQTWENYLKINYSYDENGNEIEEITQQWDVSASNWVNAQLRTTSYRGRNKEEVLFQQWKKPTGEWFNIMKYLIKYNNNGDKNAVLISLFNGVTKNWDNHKQFLMEFNNPYGPPTTVVSESWTINDWKTVGKYNIRYNWRGQKTNEIRYTWNSGNKTWLEGIMFDMIYDKSGNQTEYVEKKFNITDNTWMNFNKFNAEYNDKGYMIKKDEYKWNRQSNQWDLSGQFKFTTEIKI